jgi:hypothetical protein
MSYKFHHRRRGVQLRDDQTLRQQEVENGDVIRIQPEITAGARHRTLLADRTSGTKRGPHRRERA